MTEYVANFDAEIKCDVEDASEEVSPSYEEAKRFLRLLDPEVDEFNFQIFYSPSSKRAPRAERNKLSKALWSRLCQANQNGATIAVTVQAMKDDERKNDNVDYIRAVFLDFDDGIPDWSTLALEPSITVQTSPNRAHAYWLCTTDTVPSDFDAIQAALITRYGGDKACRDRARVLRLPGTLNLKDASKPFLAKITGGNSKRYTGAELRAAFVGAAPKGGVKAIIVEPGRSKGILGRTGQAETPAQMLAKYRHALEAMPDCTSSALSYDDWVTIGMAMKYDCDDTDEAFALFNEWSATEDPDRYEGDDACRQKWESFRGDGERLARFGTVVEIVRKQVPDFFPLSVLAPRQRPNGSTAKATPAASRNKASIFDSVRSYLADHDLTLRTNDFTHGAEVWKDGERVGDLDDGTVLDVWKGMHEDGQQIGKATLADALSAIAREEHHHPVKHYLDGLKWDGKHRVDTLFIRYGGVENTPLHRAFGRAWLIAAVRRVRKPGCEFYGMPVLEDPVGGKGKSTLFKALASPAWFDDNVKLGDASKEVIEVATGKWVLEVPELSGMGSRAFEHVKAMITRTTDTARLSYGRFATSRPRQFVLAATTNDLEYGRDGGMRRFWSMRVTGEMDVEGVRRDRDQIWAEAAYLEARREQHNIPEALWDDAREAQAARISVGVFEAIFGDRLDDAPDGFLPSAEVTKACKEERLNFNLVKTVAADMERHGFQKVNLRMEDGSRRRGYQKGASERLLKFNEHTSRFERDRKPRL